MGLLDGELLVAGHVVQPSCAPAGHHNISWEQQGRLSKDGQPGSGAHCSRSITAMHHYGSIRVEVRNLTCAL